MAAPSASTSNQARRSDPPALAAPVRGGEGEAAIAVGIAVSEWRHPAQRKGASSCCATTHDALHRSALCNFTVNKVDKAFCTASAPPTWAPRMTDAWRRQRALRRRLKRLLSPAKPAIVRRRPLPDTASLRPSTHFGPLWAHWPGSSSPWAPAFGSGRFGHGSLCSGHVTGAACAAADVTGTAVAAEQYRSTHPPAPSKAGRGSGVCGGSASSTPAGLSTSRR